MRGLDILARSLSRPHVEDKYGNRWQYHSRSDRHSKIGCWAILFDLLENSPLFRQHVQEGSVGFGINHTMRDFKSGRRKDLDLVICKPGSGAQPPEKTFLQLVADYGIKLSEEELAILSRQPQLRRVNVGSVHVALEAKACMTEHIKALPRLYDELNSSHLTIHSSSEFVIAGGFAMVNIAPTFISTDRNKTPLAGKEPTLTVHRQPDVCVRTIQKLREIPRRAQTAETGFDAFGIAVVDCRNDGAPVTIHAQSPAPALDDNDHYDNLIRRIAHAYGNRFASL